MLNARALIGRDYLDAPNLRHCCDTLFPSRMGRDNILILMKIYRKPTNSDDSEQGNGNIFGKRGYKKMDKGWR